MPFTFTQRDTCKEVYRFDYIKSYFYSDDNVTVEIINQG